MSISEPDSAEHEPALPVTLRFTLTFGALTALGWIALFLLLRSRW